MDPRSIPAAYKKNSDYITIILVCTAILVSLIVTVIMLQGNRNETLTNRKTALYNQTYNRIVTCILSVTPSDRTNAYIKGCYDQAQKDTGIQVDRYGIAQ